MNFVIINNVRFLVTNMENKDFDGDGDKDDKATVQKNIGTILLSLSSSNLFHFHFFSKGFDDDEDGGARLGSPSQRVTVQSEKA